MTIMTNAELLSNEHRITAARAVALKMEDADFAITDGDTDSAPGGFWVPASVFISDDAVDAHMLESNVDYLEDRMDAWKDSK